MREFHTEVLLKKRQRRRAGPLARGPRKGAIPTSGLQRIGIDANTRCLYRSFDRSGQRGCLSVWHQLVDREYPVIDLIVRVQPDVLLDERGAAGRAGSAARVAVTGGGGSVGG